MDFFKVLKIASLDINSSDALFSADTSFTDARRQMLTEVVAAVRKTKNDDTPMEVEVPQS